MTRLARAATAAAVAIALLPALGCSGGGAGASAASSPSGAADAMTTMRRLFEREIANPPSQDDVGAFLGIAHSAQREIDLRIFDLSEAEFVALAEAERTRKQETYIRLSRDLRRLARGAIERAHQQASAGDRQAALHTLDAVARVAQANSGPEVVAIGDLTAQRILEMVEQARSRVQSGSNGDSPEFGASVTESQPA